MACKSAWTSAALFESGQPLLSFLHPLRFLLSALTVVCDLVLQRRELSNAALGRARYELLPQAIAAYGLRLNVPICSHVVQST